MQLGPVVAVDFLQFLQARREFFHLGHRLVACRRQRKQRQLEQNGQDDDGPAPVADEVLDFCQRPVDGESQRRQPAIIPREIQAGRGGFQKFLRLRSGIQGHGKDFLLARCQRAFGQNDAR